MSKEKKYPKGFTDWKGVFDALDELKTYYTKISKLPHKKDEAIKMTVSLSFRQWDKKKGRFA